MIYTLFDKTPTQFEILSKGYVSVNSKPDYPPKVRPWGIFELENSPPLPWQKGSAKPKNHVETTLPGQFFFKLREKQKLGQKL